jgi:hypothetical protein
LFLKDILYEINLRESARQPGNSAPGARDMEKPVDGTRLPTEIGRRVIDQPELPTAGIATDNEVYTETIEGEMHLKRGTSGKFEIFSDEAPRLGGTDKYPSPMSYMAMGTGF